MDVGIVGGSGYGGGELLRLLAGHPSMEVRAVAAGSTAGRDLAEVFPHLGMSGTLLEADPPSLAGCDLVFLATPHAVSMTLTPPLLERGAAVVDLSGAFRLAPETFTTWYGLEHTAPGLAPAVYGLPELERTALPGARLVAGPGCYPTAALLALAPLAGLVDPSTVAVVGMSGTSGAGRGLRDDLHASHVHANVGAYGAPGHRHTPEIEAQWGRLRQGPERPVTFVPHLVPMARGLVCTVTAAVTGDPGLLRESFADRYDPEPFVTVLPAGVWPQTTHVVGSNAAHVGVAVDDRGGRAVVSVAIDNLGKGAAGQALQVANAMFALPETTGLPIAGIYP